MKKAFPVVIDKPRSLRYGLVALEMAEEALDKSISEIDLNKIRLKEVAVLVWAGLQHEDDTLSPKDILKLFDDHDADYVKILEVVSEAISDAFDLKEEKK